MTRAELVECIKDRVAARLCAPGERPNYVQEDMPRDIVTTALAAIEAAGCVVVPKEATMAMVKAGNCRPYREEDVHSDYIDRNTKLTWEAMLAASSLAPK
jgi:hypothetical protein